MESRKSIAFIRTVNAQPANDNHTRLPRAFSSLGWTVAHIDHDRLDWRDGRTVGYDTRDFPRTLAEFSKIWILGFGEQRSFLDRMQLLRLVPQGKFVNSVDAFVFRHAKHGLLHSDLLAYHPKTLVSQDIAELARCVNQGGNWILKPVAGSFGRDVHILRAGDTGLEAILRQATESGYVMLQKAVDAQSEKRWFVSGGDVIGCYGKVRSDHRGNLAAGSKPVLVDPSEAEEDLVATIASILCSQRIQVAALDIAHPYLLDVNFVNPGWLATYEGLTGHDLSPQVVSSLLCD